MYGPSYDLRWFAAALPSLGISSGQYEVLATHNQTSAGLEADLRRCLAEWQSHGRIDPFPLGTDDSSVRLLIPEKLYGREREEGRNRREIGRDGFDRGHGHG